MIASSADIRRLCERIHAADRVAIDTEFHHERSYAPRLMVVQLAFADGVAIVDPLAAHDLSSIVRALCSTTVVGHALAGDLKIFADRFGLVPPKVFDCQIAASFLGYGMAISLADLVRELCGVHLKKSQTVSDWSVRPLSERQIDYLIDDVAHLLQMESALSQRLKEKGRYEWALEECRTLGDIGRYRVDERRAYARIPGANRMTRRELGVLAELVHLREGLARQRDVPSKYILPDDVLAGLATLRPRTAAELAQLRRLDAGARRTLGSAILEAVSRGEQRAEEDLPARFTRPLGNVRETLVAVMNVIVGEIAREHELPPSLLVPRASLERAARELPATREDLQAILDLSPWRARLVVEPLWELLHGNKTLRIEGYGDGDPRITVQS